MKQKVLLSLLILFSVIGSAHAQISKGSLWLGGGVSYSKSKTNLPSTIPDTTRIFNITPSIGIAVSNNLVVGIKLLYSSYKDNISPLYSNQKNKQYGGGFFVRKYIPVVNRLYIFAEGDATYTHFKFLRTYSNGYADLYNKGWTGTIAFYPGLSFALTKKLQIEAGFNNLLGIQYTKANANDGYYNTNKRSETFTAGVNLENGSALFLGFRLLLNNKS